MPFLRTLLVLFFLIFGMMTPAPLSASVPDSATATVVNPETDDSRTALALELYRLSRLDAFTRNTTANIQEILLDLTADQEDEAFRAIILDAFQPELMESVLLNSLSRSIQQPAASEAIAHLEQVEIRSLTALLYDNETDFNEPETADAVGNFLLETEIQPAAFENRIRLVSEILRVSQTARITVQSIEDFLTIIIFALNQANREEEQLSDRELNELIVALRLNFRQLFDNVLLSVSLFATRDTDEQILEQHLMFLKSESGAWFIRSYNRAVLNAFGEISEQVAAGLARLAIERAEESDAFED